MYVATMHHLITMDKNLQCAVYDSDIPVTLKLGKGRQTCNKLLDSEQGYTHEKFERPPLNIVPQKAKVKVFLSNQKTHLFPLNMCNSEKQKWYFHYLHYLLDNTTHFQLHWKGTQNFQLKLFDIAVILMYIIKVTESGTNK